MQQAPAIVETESSADRGEPVSIKPFTMQPSAAVVGDNGLQYSSYKDAFYSSYQGACDGAVSQNKIDGKLYRCVRDEEQPELWKLEEVPAEG